MKTVFIGIRTTKEAANDIEVLRKLVLMPNGKKQNKNQWIEAAINEKIERDKNKTQKLAKFMNDVKHSKINDKFELPQEYEDGGAIGMASFKGVDVASIVAAHKPKEKRELHNNLGSTKKPNL